MSSAKENDDGSRTKVCLILSQSPASSNVMTSLTLSTEVHTKTGMHHVTPLSRINIKDRQQLP